MALSVNTAACCLLLAVLAVLTTAENLPVVLWHGMGDSCCNPLTMGSFKRMIQKNKPGTYVHSVQIGDNIVKDTLAGFLRPVNEQVEIACENLANDPKLAGGYNAIGFSQGAQFLRAVAQRCPHPRMHNLISIGGQHQGVYGIPQCNYDDEDMMTLCKVLRKAVTQGAYTDFVQSTVVQAQYWHDPGNEKRYREKSQFIAEINQEKDVKSEYKENLMKLNAFVMVRFNNDTMVIPVESQWFGFYRPGSTTKKMSLQESAIYTEDKLGLAEMDRAGKLHFLSLDGDHLQFSTSWFIENILNVYL